MSDADVLGVAVEQVLQLLQFVGWEQALSFIVREEELFHRRFGQKERISLHWNLEVGLGTVLMLSRCGKDLENRLVLILVVLGC